MSKTKISKTLHILLIVCFGFIGNSSQAQRLSKEELKDSILPSFSAYKDNYFVTGIPFHKEASKSTADVKYQISFKQLITRNFLPFESQLFLTYTQKAFWNVYKFSSPFQEVNFNPGLGLGKGVFDKNDELIGLMELKVEHESNGREGLASRSWNSLSLAYHTRISDQTTLGFKGWLPFAYKSDNKDLLEYKGFGELNLLFEIAPKWKLDITARKGTEWNWKGNVRSRLFYQISGSTNQHLMLEWYTGYSESLIEYTEHKSFIRVGYAIRSPDLNLLRSRSKKPLY